MMMMMMMMMRFEVYPGLPAGSMHFKWEINNYHGCSPLPSAIAKNLSQCLRPYVWTQAKNTRRVKHQALLKTNPAPGAHLTTEDTR